ncbi:MAG: GNAT family N-acetyltransferase [Treponema sp.]|uniref:GNAT family N-acetyltransferase n=1 Tax=Treponema sp. TaxID=166 RepID=UPI002A91F9D2|nr:GNAT family N-acetyltransferase [Treponema sp.]MDY6398382.1 GNAT family N-acetyltransferase [Treponema sp.]
MENIIAKIASISDVDIIKTIYNEARTFGRSSGSCDWTDDYPNDEIINYDMEHNYLYIVYSGEKPIALFSLMDTDDLDNEPLSWTQVKSGVPARICIAPQLQGKGYGKKIMHELIQVAKQRGYQSLRLLADKKHTPANKLYQSLNFQNKGAAHLYETDFNAYELIL